MFILASIGTGALLGFAAASMFLGPNETRTAMGGRVALALIGALAGWWASSLAEERGPIAWAEEVVQVKSTARFDELLKASTEKPVLVEFYADWCGPCRRSSSHLNALAKEGRSVAVVNSDEQEELVDRYEVMGVPTVFILHEGEVRDEVVGSLAEDELRELLDAYE